MKTQDAQGQAAARMMIIMPLLDENLDPKSIVELKKKLAAQHEISYRTISRYYDAYLKDGFDGLKPKQIASKEHSLLPENFQEIVDTAIELRRECPSRSVNDIIRIMELENIVPQGSVSRSTLQRHLQKRGFGSHQMKIYTQKGVSARRFQKSQRCMLFQGDIKYGPYLSIGKNGAKKQVYLSAFIDDATRFIVAAKFYEHQQIAIIEDTLRTAIMQYGKPDAIYVDNGKQYRSSWLGKACTQLGIKLLFAKPYHPEGKGKIEAFNRRIDSFLSEVALTDVKTLDELNRLLKLWIDDHYHKTPHHGLGGITPEVAFKTDKRSLKFIDMRTLTEAFLHSEERTVDKTGCISFEGKRYEIGLQLIGRKVEAHYDPSWANEIEIHHPDFVPFMAKEQVVGEHCGTRSGLPQRMTPLKPESSRFLDGLNKANISGRTRQDVAVVFRKNREVSDHV
ncbi:DDE-type integrase/transposase/recombinase [Proteiniborus sp.]|uniref:DDE-type integrase/transposase/recombinase n=1 Tax=Proteiniborus sp. TaxID=2079015 RepID=UPI003330AFFE